MTTNFELTLEEIELVLKHRENERLCVEWRAAMTAMKKLQLDAIDNAMRTLDEAGVEIQCDGFIDFVDSETGDVIR